MNGNISNDWAILGRVVLPCGSPGGPGGPRCIADSVLPSIANIPTFHSKFIPTSWTASDGSISLHSRYLRYQTHKRNISRYQMVTWKSRCNNIRANIANNIPKYTIYLIGQCWVRNKLPFQFSGWLLFSLNISGITMMANLPPKWLYRPISAINCYVWGGRNNQALHISVYLTGALPTPYLSQATDQQPDVYEEINKTVECYFITYYKY